MLASEIKDPDAVLDYMFDWAGLSNENGREDWLDSGETISSHTVTVQSGLTLDSSALTNSNTSVVAWLSGGTEGENYTVTCQIVTSDSRTDERTLMIRVRER